MLCARLERRDAWGAGADRSDLRAVVGELRDLRAWEVRMGEGVGRSRKSRDTPEKNEQDQKQQQ